MLVNKTTGAELARVNQAAGPVDFVGQDQVVVIAAGNIDYYSVPNLENIYSVSWGATDVLDVNVGKTSNQAYTSAFPDTDLVGKRDLDGTFDASTTLPSVTSDICAFLLSDDENTIYIIDAESDSASSVYFRVYDITTFGSPSLIGSVQLTSTVNGERFSELGFVAGFVVARTTGGGALVSAKLDIIDISTPSSPTIADSGSTAQAVRGCAITDGSMYAAYNDIVCVFQVPGHTLVQKGHWDFDLLGGDITSVDVIDSSGNQVHITPQDLIRSVNAYVSNTPRTPTIRTVTASGAITAEDKGNIIKVVGHSATVNLTADADVLADDTFYTTVIGDITTYNVQVVHVSSTSAVFRLTSLTSGWATSDFKVAGGEMLPKTDPTYQES